ncbi:hypothetical protein FRB99_008957, partial [Tulasnella sp. 403]
VISAVIVRDEHPAPGPSFSASGLPYAPLWELASRCWARLPSDRVPMIEVIKVFEGILANLASQLTIHGMIQIDQQVQSRGGFGEIFRGSHHLHGEVALKRLFHRNDNEIRTLVELKLFMLEAQTWHSLDHHHILKFLGIYIIEDRKYMVSPWAYNGSLPDYIATNPTADRVKFLHQTALALAYLHLSSVIHGDIKAGNILVSSDGHALLCDFGLSRSAMTNTDPFLKGMGSVRWQAPELMDENPKSFSSDVYAFGITIFEREYTLFEV